MASTSTEICNLALLRVRADEVGDITEQSAGAEKCRVFYPQARDFVLTAAPWQFAKTTRALSLKDVTLHEWEYCYDYPNDCLRIGYIIPTSQVGSSVNDGLYSSNLDDATVEYEVLTGADGSRYIGTNQADAIMAYTKSVEDVRLFDPLFVEVLAWRLAQDLAIPLGGDSGKKYRNDAIEAYTSMMSMAMAKDANERHPRIKKPEPREVSARGGFGYNRIYRRT